MKSHGALSIASSRIRPLLAGALIALLLALAAHGWLATPARADF